MQGGDIVWEPDTWRTITGLESGFPSSNTAVDQVPSHDPPLCPRDEAIFLLQVAAEIEHSLMVQYLYATFALNFNGDLQIQNWRKTILGIAKEEMGHFITVQNLLRLIGGPLRFEREDIPFQSEYYPFPFSLRPLTIAPPKNGNWDDAGSLNRYIAAEMPAPDQISEHDRPDVQRIIGAITTTESVASHVLPQRVNRVGRLYAKLIDVFSVHLEDSDFIDRASIEGYLATRELWNRSGETYDIIILAPTNREQAVVALKYVAEQGEGDLPGGPESHFQKFLSVYRQFELRAAENTEWTPNLPVPIDPTTARESGPKGNWRPITNIASRLWAQLFDIRYRLALALIEHHLVINEKDSDAVRAKRRFLANTAISEMHTLSGLAQAIVSRPLGTGSVLRAAPTFEIPYTFDLPDREADRDRVYLAILSASAMLVRRIRDIDNALCEKERAQLIALEWHDLILRRTIVSKEFAKSVGSSIQKAS